MPRSRLPVSAANRNTARMDAPRQSAPASAPWRYLDENATADALGVSPRTLQRWRRDGGGPAYIRVGVRRVAYDVQVIEDWTAGRTYAHRAAELAREGGA